MKLAPELRNTIYKYALRLDDGIIQISEQTGVPEPPLLLTCKDIRREALPLFYTINNVRVVVDSYSPAMPLFFHKKQLALFAQYNRRLAASQLTLRGPVKWRNLVLWLRCVHAMVDHPVPIVRLAAPLGTGVHVRMVTDYAKMLAVVAGLFRIVCEMRQLPWVRLRETVAWLRYGLVKYDAAWEVD